MWKKLTVVVGKLCISERTVTLPSLLAGRDERGTTLSYAKTVKEAGKSITPQDETRNNDS
jgi:hypothetical protein